MNTMKSKPSSSFTVRAIAAAMSLALAAPLVHADDRAEVEQVRATTMALLQALVESGLISRDKADAIVRQAQQARPAAAPSGSAASGAAPANVVRVPYVSETTKAEMREQIKQEVLAQAKTERWGEPGALPEWLNRISLDGDLRARWQMEMFDKNNWPAYDPSGVRAQTQSPAWSPDLANTTNDRNRMTLRARLGVNANLGGGFSTELRAASGSNASPVSTSQTLGSNLSKYSLWLDRAAINWQPRSDVRVSVGRFGNPFYGTDLTWPDDLNFDGAAASYKPRLNESASVFVTAGAFPLQEFELTASEKWLYGAQAGGAWKLNPQTELSFGVALYDFVNVAGEYDGGAVPSGVRKGTTAYLSSEYPASVRQKGNTLIRLNPGTDPANPSTVLDPTWGLASKFRPIDVSASLSFNQFAPVVVQTSLDYVKNTAFDLNDIRSRTALPSLDVSEKTTALQARVNVGMPKIERSGDWQAFMAWRRVERDAWIDAFTDTTWNLGGTNYQGWSLGAQYGVAPKTSVGARWTSTRNLTDGTYDLSSAPLKIDVFQLELNSRF